MKNLTSAKQRELIQSIREEHNKNRLKMCSRQNYLYDNTVTNSAVEMTHSSQSAGSMGIRILLSIVLFSLFIIMDNFNLTVLDVNTTQIHEFLLQNYAPNSFAFIEEITYTLTHG